MPPTLDPDILQRWIGRTETTTDTIRAEPARLMQMTLDRVPVLSDGDALPPLWHWLYFLQSARISELGRDGHPALGGFLPPVGLPRRMWAGGRFGFSAPLRIGQAAEKQSVIKDVQLKQGRSGALCFVTIRHEVGASGATPAFWEEHDIVYREDPKPDDAARAPQPLGTDWDGSERVTAQPVVLFRYSALTFNGHRIHYDRDYARNVEGHGGLVVHGPLIATLLADRAVQQGPDRPLTGFEFRALSPVFDTGSFTLNWRQEAHGVALAAGTSDGHLAMQATATFAGEK